MDHSKKISLKTGELVGTGHAAERITATEWDLTNHIDAVKSIASEQSDVDIDLQLYTLGGMILVPTIRAAWPRVGIDLAVGYEGSLQIIAQEGWADPVTVEKVPNIAEIPERLLIRDGAGNIINIPRSESTGFWFYREDIAPFEIRNLDDLLDPRLKGKICFPALTSNSGAQLLSLAMYRGGDERNLEPGWDFLKELARSGNIGRVTRRAPEHYAALASGECCIMYEGGTIAVQLARRFKVCYLVKMDPKTTGFWTYMYHHAWSVLKGGKTDAAFKFANFAIGAEKNEEFNRIIGALPVNKNSKVSAEMKPLAFNDEEIDRYTYTPDYAYLTEQSGAWLRRWEQEIAPLLSSN